jgi:voltage-gated potassium channel
MDVTTWERRSDGLLIGASLVFLAAYAWDVLDQPRGSLGLFGRTLIFAAWAIFAIDYMIRLRLAENRSRWFFHHLLDLAVVLLPMLRPLRLLRLITLLGVVQRVAGTALRGRVALYVCGTTVLIVFVSSLAMLDAERHAVGATITTFGDSVWWAFVTITTVGYGDYTPVTTTGRLIAVVMMTAGIALLGTVTATLASWFVQRISEEDEASQSATRAQVRDLSAEITALRREPAETSGRGPAGPPVGTE